MKLTHAKVRIRAAATLAVAGTLLSFADRPAVAQERWQADVRVTAIQAVLGADAKFRCTVDLTSDNDDDARGTPAIVVLPVGVTDVLPLQGTPEAPRSDTCATSNPPPPSGGAGDVRGFVACDLGQLGVSAKRRIEVTSSAPPPPFAGKTCAAFAWSRTPDPQPRNNYAEATAP
jgi:hypothetical protein